MFIRVLTDQNSLLSKESYWKISDRKESKFDLDTSRGPEFLGVIFDHFAGPKSHFLDFFKVVLELFGKCLGIVFDLKRPTFGVFSARKVDK